MNEWNTNIKFFSNQLYTFSKQLYKVVMGEKGLG